jgi:predicted AlkP superfamily pyrophosphatase or phosphodiesterase
MQQAKHQQWLAERSVDSVSGSHGYDNASPAMQAIFIGHGPSFVAGRTLPAFANIELYNLMCRILRIQPTANDGDPAWAAAMQASASEAAASATKQSALTP